MQMSFGDLGGSGGSTPSWARPSNEPMLPTLDVASVKKSVNADIKELKKAAEALGKLAMKAKKQPDASVGEQLLSISAAARERARTTSRTLRMSLDSANEGSPEHKALTALSDEFKQALIKFQKQVEDTSYLVPPPPVAGPSSSLGNMDAGPPSGGGDMNGSNNGWGQPPGVDPVQQQQQDEMHTQIAVNDAIIAERDQGIGNLARSVQEVADIYQDLALLVQEQGTQIDNIQTNIESAATQTERGVRELHRANKSQKKARSRMCIIALCILAIMIVLVLVLKFGMNKM